LRPNYGWLDPADTPLALGALAVRLARQDLAPLALDSARIDAALAHRYDLTRSEAEEMRRACEEVAAAVPPGSGYSRLVAQHVAADERDAFARCLWREARRPAADPDAARTLARTFGLPETAFGAVGRA
jgi:hypothetical protein